MDPTSPGDPLTVQFLRQAPHLPSASDLAVTSCPVEPWPHQLRVVREAVERYPESFLFADEVGLGKTIEAGLALRQLAISGRVRRALILVPKALLRQWQEELHEKLVLRVPRFEGGRWLDLENREVVLGPPATSDSNPWNGEAILLASTQLARRRERRDVLLSAEPWDLVIVDEAHHARRRGLGTATPRPNLLLELLAGNGERPGLVHRSRCLYLLSATPMQVHPLEAFDLLRLLGLGGRWGSDGGTFLRFFEELARPWEQRDWNFLLPLARESWGRDAMRVRGGPSLPDPLGDPSSGREALSAVVDGEVRRQVEVALRRATPFASFSFRHTRDLLRRYRRDGVLEARIPERKPENVWIDPSPEEAELYRRIEDTLGELYRRYEARRRGLGFVMTLYRRRLTSSFAAMERSLERRLAWLEGQPAELFESDEVEAEGGSEDAARSAGLFERADRLAEREVLERYLEGLRKLPGDSKLARLRRDLEEWLPERGKVIVFTQYLDTLDFLRGELIEELAGEVGCYSGRGGELWDGETASWRRCSKEAIKEAFRDSDALRVLLCTEAAGEGLNLQTCGALINFDMPWNPMRVEQRIGRIDRIGQRHDTVWVRNYFYRDTVEAVVYQRLADRIAWFEQVVGTLQPILQRVESTIEHVALAGSRRDEVLAAELDDLSAALDGRARTDLGLDRLADSESFEIAPAKTAFHGQEVEQVVLGVGALAQCLEAIPTEPGVYRLRLEGEPLGRVTFLPEVFDRRPYSVKLLTWGEPHFERLLDQVVVTPELETPIGIGLYRTSEPQPVALFVTPEGDGGCRVVETLEDLRHAVGRPMGPWPARLEAEAASLFSSQRGDVLRHRVGIERERRDAERRSLLVRAQGVLLALAHVELARDRSPRLFDESLGYGFGRQAITGLGRHGGPFPALLAVTDEGLVAREDDPGFLDLVGRAASVLERREAKLRAEAHDVAERLARLVTETEVAEQALRSPSAGGVLERWWFATGAQEVPKDEPFDRLESDGVRPFVDAVPLYSDLAEVARRFTEPALGSHPQSSERQRPGDFDWVRPAGRAVAGRGLFVAPIGLAALDQKVGRGGFGLLRLHPKQPRPGAVVLVAHPDLVDPELGDGVTLRHATLEPGGLDRQGDWRPARLRLEPASDDPRFETVVLDDLEEQPPILVAELVEVL